MEEEITTRHLQGLSDLTLVAPIRQGLIGALETRTYASRLRAVLKTLHTLRVTSREYSLVRTISDSTDRIRTISDLRIVILEPEQKLLLSVTFDRPWQPYLRIVHREVGTLLDLIFCNCEGYVTSVGHSFAEYGEWIARARSNTRFFYKTFGSTVDDVMYLRQAERLAREGAPALDLELARLIAADPANLAAGNGGVFPFELATQGLQALAVLYRLVDQYPSDHPDGAILERAAPELLREFKRFLPMIRGPARSRFAAQLSWFEALPKTSAPLPAAAPAARVPLIQAGILNGYPQVTHGCLLLIGLRDAPAAARFLAALQPRVTADGAAPVDGVHVNVAFTCHGLRRLGVESQVLERFPPEFREGMEERAGLLGDVRGNHPRNWAMPPRNWPTPSTPATGQATDTVELSEVHLVVQLRCSSRSTEVELAGNPAHPLHATVTALMQGRSGARLLSVQAMRSQAVAQPGNLSREHFGFIDGVSQPELGTASQATGWSNKVALGDLLLGQPNALHDVPEVEPLCQDGSFLVVRKLRQDVRALDAMLDRAVADKAVGLTREQIKAKMMGRTLEADPLVSPAPPASPAPPPHNAFDYGADPAGALCPFQAHVRRSNPRTVGDVPVPRLMRRGMSYGPRFEDQPDAARGIVFMAYNASIAEQFEVVQGWIAGGNSTGVLSDQSDPFLGVPQIGDARCFRFLDGERVVRVNLDDPAAAPSRPFVQLEWGVYLFTPSMASLQMLSDIASRALPANAPEPALVKDGEQTIRRLRQLEAAIGPAAADSWKAALEDANARTTRSSEAVWAAIRERHHGVLRTPYGVLVAEKALVEEVLLNAEGAYSVCGYAQRLHQSIGNIYLGLDDGPAYRAQAAQANAAISAIDGQDAFLLARVNAAQMLAALVDASRNAARDAIKLPPRFKAEPHWELTLDIKELSDHVLAALCGAWFGLPDGNLRLAPGGWRWDWASPQPPTFPGHFTAPSRYLFQPNPGGAAQRHGQLHGQALRDAMNKLVRDHRASGTAPTGRLAQAIFAAFPDAADNDLLARTLIGALMGFLPTVDGNLRSTLYEWLEERSFWELRGAYLADPRTDRYVKARAILLEPLLRTMQLRPVPELVWRTATRQHKLGGVEVRPEDRVVVALVSATQQDRVAGNTSVCPVFGGDRRAAAAPTHACPGYDIAIGVLLGVVTALIEVGPLRPTPAPLVVSLRGPV